jgi:hypothetical protein
MSDKALRAGLIRLAHSHPEFRKELLPILTACGPEAPMQGKFEEGKPADPTKNMSPEDAAEWKKQTEEHADQFKTATLRKVLIRLASEHPPIRSVLLPLLKVQ